MIGYAFGNFWAGHDRPVFADVNNANNGNLQFQEGKTGRFLPLESARLAPKTPVAMM